MDIADVIDNFIKSLNACTDLYNFCLSPRGIHTYAGVEAAFLQLQTAWENFIEETILLYLCGKQPLSGDSIETHFIVLDLEVARKILYQNKNYCNWKVQDIDTYLKIYFKPIAPSTTSNRIINAIDNARTTLEQIDKIRNVIAHSSKHAKEQFENICKKVMGSYPARITRAADFLLEPDKSNAPNTYFNTYVGVLETCAKAIAGKV